MLSMRKIAEQLPKENIKQIALNNLAPNTPTFLVSCHAGKENGLAQEISKIFNAIVIAAINTVSFFSAKITSSNEKIDINFFETPG